MILIVEGEDNCGSIVKGDLGFLMMQLPRVEDIDRFNIFPSLENAFE